MLYKEQINKGVEFIARGLAADLDAYSLAAAASALAAARHPQAGLALHMMDRYVNSSGNCNYYTNVIINCLIANASRSKDT